MKDKTQKSFRGIVRILLLVFCYTFGSHAFALALEHEQTVDIYKVTDVPNPRNESSSNWVSKLRKRKMIFGEPRSDNSFNHEIGRAHV